MKNQSNILTKVQTPVETSRLDDRLETALVQAIKVVRDNEIMLGFAESCTGGLLSRCVTQQAGVSDIFWGSVVSYANESKSLFLGVQDSVFKTQGAVSAECAKQMAEGLAVQIQKTTPKNVVTVSLTGVAGPNGGSALKPVGTVFIAVTGTNLATQIFHHEFVSTQLTAQATGLNSTGIQAQLSRDSIQKAAAVAAFELIDKVVNQAVKK